MSAVQTNADESWKADLSLSDGVGASAPRLRNTEVVVCTPNADYGFTYE